MHIIATGDDRSNFMKLSGWHLANMGGTSCCIAYLKWDRPMDTLWILRYWYRLRKREKKEKGEISRKILFMTIISEILTFKSILRLIVSKRGPRYYHSSDNSLLECSRRYLTTTFIPLSTILDNHLQIRLFSMVLKSIVRAIITQY
jgi:hypothetical protein